jgi:YYY domain-containing protein
VATSMRRVLPWLCLAALIIAGGVLRFQHINWDEFQHVHPDERFIVWVADTISWPGSLRSALDPATSTLDPFRWPPNGGDLAGQPRGYAYGHFPLYLLVGVAHLAQSSAESIGSSTIALPAILQPIYSVGRHLAEYDSLPLVGRAISAMCDLGTLLLVFALGRRAFGRLAGLIAAGFYAFAVLPIQLSHFYAVDLVLTFCVAATVYLAARCADRGGWGAWILAGIAAGLAVGSKFSAVMLAAPLFVAALWRLPSGPVKRKAATVLGRMAVVGGVCLLAFALTNPFALIEARAYLSNILSQQAMVSGAWDVPYTRQYAGTWPYVYFVQQLSQWGLGWPLGLIGWGGLLWLCARALRRRATSTQLIILAWMMPYLVLTGAFYAKFLRYMAPLVPFLMICGAGASVAAYRWASGRWRRPGRIGVGLAGGVVVLITIGWVLAFTGIYRQEHPWIRASRWIYQNIPAGSRVLTEHWDDSLPLRLDGVLDRPPAREYERVELPLYDADTAAKLDALVSELAGSDYVVVASNRLYAPIGRLPGRYPMTSQYYRMLFAGELGYEKVAEFATYPSLGPVSIRDDNADESFTVYDHPHVMIFANVDRLKPSLLRARLERYLPLGSNGHEAASRAGRQAARPPGHARFLPVSLPPQDEHLPGDGLSTGLTPQAGSETVIADFRWDRFASEWPPAAVLAWALVLSVFGLIAWPLLFPVMEGLRDRGFGLAGAVGWLLVGWTHWMGASFGLWENRTWIIGLIVIAWGLAALLAWLKQRAVIAAFWAAHRRLLLAEAAVFGIGFLAFVGIRLLNPDLWQPWNGGEKFMEVAFINATLRSPSFPPYDPYFAGGTINYYYYGLYLMTLPMKLTGIASEVSFNLAVPGMFALAAMVLVSAGSTLASRGEGQEGGAGSGVLGAALGLGMALLLSNLAAFRTAVRSLKGVGEGLSAIGRFLSAVSYDFWAPSRVIPFTINEFPLWTFVFADLHPHLIAMPFGLVVVALSFNWVKAAASRQAVADSSAPQEVAEASRLVATARSSPSWVRPAVRILLLAIVLGSIGPINTWDLPTYFALLLAALLLAGWRQGRLRAVLTGGLAAVLTGGLAIAAYWPFYVHYRSPIARGSGPLLERVLGLTRQGSPLDDWLLVWGIFLFLAYGLALMEYLRPSAASHREGSVPDGEAVDRRRVIVLLLVLAVAALLAALQRPAAAVAAIPLVLLILIVLRRWLSPEEAFLGVLVAVGLGILVGLEVVYVRDFLDGGDWYRMNSVFKFSMPAWLFLGLGLGMLWGRWWEARRARRQVKPFAQGGLGPRVWHAAAILLLVAGSSYLLLGIQARVRDRFPGPRPAIGTLDGTAYMTVGEYTWPDSDHVIQLAYDYQAIHWMLDNLQGSPVVAEAPAGGYEVAGQFQGYDYYRAGGLRVASLTGFPTFVGQHQNEQRPAEEVTRRAELGQEFFRTGDIDRAKAIARQLDVRYIYVGTLERILFSQSSLAKFDGMVKSGDLEIAYQNPEVTLYRVAAEGS